MNSAFDRKSTLKFSSNKKFETVRLIEQYVNRVKRVKGYQKRCPCGVKMAEENMVKAKQKLILMKTSMVSKL